MADTSAERSTASPPSIASAKPAAAEEIEPELRYLWNRRHELLERSVISSVYHKKRERFFGFWDRTTTAIALIAGTAAFSELVPTSAGKSYAGLVVAVSTMFALVFSWADISRRHSSLAARFKSLEADIEGQGERDFTEAHLNAWERQLRLLEIEEPPQLSTLVDQVQYEVSLAKWDPDSGDPRPVPVPFRKRLLMHFFDLGVTTLPKPH